MNIKKMTLESLIAEHEQRISTLYRCSEYPYYRYDDWASYQEWLIKTTRYLHIKYSGDKFVSEFESIATQDLHPEQQGALLAILKSLLELPTIVPMKQKKNGKEINVNTTINNSNSQSQNQEQSIAVNLFLEAIKDDLTGKQVKELKDVLVECGNDKPKAWKSIVEKLKSFGSDVAANIVANILTNPTIWMGFVS